MNKNFLKTLILFLAIFNTAFSAEGLSQQKKEDKYNNIISFLEKNSENFDKIYFYKIKVQKGIEQKKIQDLKQSELGAFFVYQAQYISDIMFVIDFTWNKELANAPEEEKKVLKSALNDLHKLRIKHALKFETILEKNLEKIKNLNHEEKQGYLIKIRRWNEEQKLINRE